MTKLCFWHCYVKLPNWFNHVPPVVWQLPQVFSWAMCHSQHLWPLVVACALNLLRRDGFQSWCLGYPYNETRMRTHKSIGIHTISMRRIWWSICIYLGIFPIYVYSMEMGMWYLSSAVWFALPHFRHQFFGVDDFFQTGPVNGGICVLVSKGGWVRFPPKSTGRYQKYPNMMFFKVYLLSNIWLHFGYPY